MDDRLDEELKNRIKKVFDEYQDPSADEGWAGLREKFPERAAKRRGLIWLWLSAAAVTLLVLSIRIWKYSGNNLGQNAAIVKNVIPPNANPPAVKPAESQPPQVASASSPSAAANGPERHLSQGQNVVRGTVSLPAATNVAIATARNQAKNTGNPPLQVQQANSGTANSNIIPARTDSNRIAVGIPRLDQSRPGNKTSLGASQAVATQPANKPKDMADMFAQKNNPQQDEVDIKPSRIRLGVYAASFVNYAKGSGSQGNVGVGFSAEVRLAKHLKLVTGITLAQNSLSYGGAVPAGAVQTGFFSPSLAPSYYGIADAGPVVKTASAADVASIPAFKNYGVSMLNIDVPVNLKFDFNLKQNNFYVMSGLSSGTFANETYTYHYNYPALPSPELQAPHAETSKSNFSNIYVGKMLNLAIGYGYPIGRNHIIIEPFLKYPLGGMGTQDIRFGAGGINLKLNFPTK